MCMSVISKHTLIIIINCYFLFINIRAIVGKDSFQKNGTNNSKQFQEIEKDLINQASIDNLTTLDYYFFSYNVIDHNTLLIKFDITRTILFQQTQILYDAYLYVSKIPRINYKINIGPFSGYFEKELDGTITDHFTFCLVLIPNPYQTKFNITSNRNKTKTIFHKYLKSSNQKQQQYILHYCTKMGPDEDRYHHQKKQGSEGDRILLLLQLMMIGIFLVIIQISHMVKKRKYKEWRHRQISRIRDELLLRKQHPDLSDETLKMLRFTTVNNEESQEEEEEEEEYQEEETDDPLTLSHRRLPTPIIKRKRSRSPSPSIGPANINIDDSATEHILESKPWLQIPQ